MNEVKLMKEDIELKTLTLDDANELYKLIDKNRVQISEWLIWAENIKTLEDAVKLIKEYNERRRKDEGINFGIWFQKKLIGAVSFASIKKDYRKAKIAYWLDSDYQGMGIITKSCKQLIEYGFTKLNLHRIEISCAVGNSKSRAIPERLGFKVEGIFKESELIRGGKLVDDYHYALLEQDWKKK